jgi:hypothetical protein
MMDLHADLSAVFFGADFATAFTRQRTGAADVQVVLILGATDEDALDGRAIATTRTARLPATADLRVDDVLVAAQALPALGVAEGQRFTVLDAPRRANDGMELEALLGSA